MKKRISEAAADAWGVPKDVIMNIPRFTISGDREIYIENHKGLLGYTDKEIRVLTGMGTVKICGKNLSIDRIRLEDILISGKFDAVEYEI
ncbi:MAG: sporulation protein YqfC [Oscillospiraceae bacterium]|nr:sporulation protein YqfC [Oscillospiraceae bacterium]